MGTHTFSERMVGCVSRAKSIDAAEDSRALAEWAASAESRLDFKKSLEKGVWASAGRAARSSGKHSVSYTGFFERYLAL